MSSDPDLAERPPLRAWARWSWIAEALAIFAASRAVVYVALYSMRPLLPHLAFGRALSTWDGQWYAMIARHGYPHSVSTVDKHALSSIAFFPVYPALMRGVSRVTGISVEHAGIAISLLLGASFIVLLWYLVDDLFDVDVARRTALLVCFFPGSLVLSMVYSEATMLAAVVAAFILLRRQQWVWAGLAGAFAAATRPNAAAFAVATLVVAIVAARAPATEPATARWKPFITPALSACGVIGVLAFFGIRTGEAGVWFRVQRDGWDEYFDPRRRFDEVTFFFRHPFSQQYNTTVFIGLVFLVFALWCLWQARHGLGLALVTYALVSLIPTLTSYSIGPRPRFLLAAFPLLIAVAVRLKGTVFVVTVAIFASALVAYTTLITPGHFVTP